MLGATTMKHNCSEASWFDKNSDVDEIKREDDYEANTSRKALKVLTCTKSLSKLGHWKVLKNT